MSRSPHTAPPRSSRSIPSGGVQVPLVAVLVIGIGLFAIGVGVGRSIAVRDAGSSGGSPVVAASGNAEAEPTPVVAEPAPITSTPAAPSFAFDPPELDFGIVGPKDELTASFRVVNTGVEPLRVLAMKPSCSCTTLENLAGVVLEPGKSRTLTAIVDPRDYPGEKITTIRFLFAGHDPVDYSIRSVVMRAVVTDPPYLSALEQSSGRYEVSSADGTPFRILGVNGERPAHADDFDPDRDDARNRYLLAWDVTGYDPTTCRDEQGRPMPKWWAIETDHPDAPVIDLRMRHQPCTALELPRAGRQWLIDTTRTLLGVMEPGSSREFSVEAKWLPRARVASAFAITRVEAVSDDFTAELVDTIDGEASQTCRVRVTVDPDHRGLVYGDVRFFSRVPGQSQAVTVIARVPRPGEERGR
ncbi:MAG: DUF1573 domain-containing protein [Phycisphaerae bacterium]|nr:DUF1573 domain-containing protein [Phycisphaerae bacterium]